MEWMDRFVEVMEVLSARPREGVGITVLANETGLSKGTLYRMLQNMVEHKLVIRVQETKKYRLGPRAMSWGSRFIAGQDASGILADFVDQLALQSNLYSYLSRFVANEVYCIYTQQPSHERNTYFVHVGQRMPLYCSASGKAILAYRPRNEWESLLNSEERKKYTEATKTSVDEIVEELHAAKQVKIARCIEVMESGISALSTPLFAKDGRVVFSLSLVGNAEYVRTHEQELIEKLLRIGSEASEHLTAIGGLSSLD